MAPYLLGIDAGSSAVKTALVEAGSGAVLARAASPADEMAIRSPHPGWAEQDPREWWRHLGLALAALGRRAGVDLKETVALGISYQMHGLVLVDARGEPLRPAIIWCDGRALPLGEGALAALGRDRCLEALLNSPGNFTATRLAWVREKEPETFARAACFLLPGDWLALRLTGRPATTIPGLSEAILWDFAAGRRADFLLDHLRIPAALVPPLVPACGDQGRLTRAAAAELGLREGTPLCWRAGDQTANAFALGVVDPGQAAASGGTSGVIYGVMDEPARDPRSRVNTFVHANHTPDRPRYAMLACVNGTGILNRWLRENTARGEEDYAGMNRAAAAVPPGAEGLSFLPYGNGPERTLEGRCPGACCLGLDLNRHGRNHLLRAAQEGIAFALVRCLEIMAEAGREIGTIRAARTGLFRSPIFRETLAATAGAELELHETDGAAGAARGAGLGAGVYRDEREAFRGLGAPGSTPPDPGLAGPCRDAYARWTEGLHRLLPDLEE